MWKGKNEGSNMWKWGLTGLRIKLIGLENASYGQGLVEELPGIEGYFR